LSRGTAVTTLGAFAAPAIQVRGANERFVVGMVDAPDADTLLGRSYREGHWASL